MVSYWGVGARLNVYSCVSKCLNIGELWKHYMKMSMRHLGYRGE